MGQGQVTAKYPGTPRWVKASALLVLFVALLVVVMHAVGMGPGLHAHLPPAVAPPSP